MRKWCCIIIGLIYALSGVLKLIDPVGTGLIVDSYLQLFKMDTFSSMSKHIGVVLGLLESAVGFALLLLLWNKALRLILIIMQTSFTAISIALLIMNPPMHCGCFGEVIHLTHFQTFIKNLFLVGMLVFAKGCVTRKRVQMQIWITTIALLIILMLYSWFNVPLFDSTNYKTGTRVIEMDQYRRLAEQEQKSVEPLPLFRGPETINADISDGTWGIISLYENPSGCDEWLRIIQKAKRIQSRGFNCMLLVVATADTLKNGLDNLFGNGQIDPGDLEMIKQITCYTDRTTVLSLNRINGGITVIDNGIIVKKSRVY